MIELNKLKMLAQGGQAKIYELDKDKVLRVLRNKTDTEYLKKEMSVMRLLKKNGKAVPEVYEYIEVEGRPALIIERLTGYSMMEEIQRSPLFLKKYAKKLAILHMEVAGSSEGLDLSSLNERAAYFIPMADLLATVQKEFVLNILRTMPVGTDICHGDFHPGNIIESKEKYYVIDWFGVTSGRKLADIAHSYLLLRNAPQMPGTTKLYHRLVKFMGNILSRKYLYACIKLLPQFDYAEFSKWMVIRAAERVFYGMPTEKTALIKFIDRCRKASQSGIPYSNWWKFI